LHRKVFDTYSHEILLRKLHKLGIHNTSLDWFKSYLSDRSQNLKLIDTSLTCSISHAV
jgi:hypothetical protein